MTDDASFYVLDCLIILFLIVLNGFFAMSELALVSSRKQRLKTLMDEGHRGARVALNLAENPGRFLSTLQVGITLVGILSGVYGGEELAPPLERFLADFVPIAPFSEALAIFIIVSGITYATIIIGELVPKHLGLKNPERIASLVAPLMTVIATLAAPLVYVIEGSARGFLRFFGVSTKREATVTEAEVKDMIAEGVTAGVLKPAEREMMAGVMRVADWRVQAIMTARPDIVWIDLEDNAEQVRRKFQETAYSRLPVARRNLDEIVGVVHAKDLLSRALDGEPLDIAGALSPPLFVRPQTLAIQVLDLLKTSPLHMVFVVNERGTLEGLVTATDIVKWIIGHLAEPGAGADSEVTQREDGSWLIGGDIHIDIVKDLLDLRDIPSEEDFYTLAGFMLSHFGQIPAAGDRFEWRGFRFEVMDMDGLRIDKVMITPPGPITIVPGDASDS
ncbi:MAG: hemolysin family protein [Gammaproteobacteria bacterium]